MKNEMNGIKKTHTLSHSDTWKKSKKDMDEEGKPKLTKLKSMYR